MAANRITTTNRVIALKIPNTDDATNTWPHYVTSANEIQVDTGFTFFTALPADVAAALRSKVDGSTNPPPIILSFSPASGATNATVTITQAASTTMVTCPTLAPTYTGSAITPCSVTVTGAALKYGVAELDSKGIDG